MNFIAGIFGSILFGGIIAVAFSFMGEGAKFVNPFVAWITLSALVLFIYTNIKANENISRKLMMGSALLVMLFMSGGIISLLGSAIPTSGKPLDPILLVTYLTNGTLLLLAIAFVVDIIETRKQWLGKPRCV